MVNLCCNIYPDVHRSTHTNHSLGLSSTLGESLEASFLLSRIESTLVAILCHIPLAVVLMVYPTCLAPSLTSPLLNFSWIELNAFELVS